MAYLVKKNRYKNMVYSKPFLLLVFLLIIFVIRGTWGVYQKNRDTSKTLKNVTEDLIEIEERKSILLEQIEERNTEKGIETEIRKRFDVAKEGEKLIILIDKKEKENFKVDENKSFWNWISKIFE